MTTQVPNAPEGPAPEARVTGGLLGGRYESGIAVFRGVPYAAPPVGPYRFAAPQSPAHWDGVRPAASFGPPPPQTGGLGRRPSESAGDDWLTLNVWSPALHPAAKLPVMVWIQGGAYVVGDAGWSEYDGGHLARDGDVVVVTCNYRLGMEGFAAVEGAPANRGLLDQVAALRWVHENIAAFGGDAGRVTIFGESAGGGSVAALLVMPTAAGLFRGAVAQSVPGTFFSPELGAEIAAACAAELGLRPTVADLAGADPTRLAAAADAVTATAPTRARWGPAGYRSILFSPVVDGEVLPSTPWQGLAAGRARDVALVAGHTRDEHRLFAALTGELGQVTPDAAALALDVLAPAPDGAQRYRDAYPDAGPNELSELVHSDWLFRMPTLHLAEAQVAGGGRAHLYELTWPAPGLGGALGACHGLDVPLVFGNLTSGQPAMLIGERPRPDTVELSARMRSAWTTFAARGDPGWPGYTPHERLTQILDAPCSLSPYPEHASRLIWETHAFAPLTIPRRP